MLCLERINYMKYKFENGSSLKVIESNKIKRSKRVGGVIGSSSRHKSTDSSYEM